MRVKQVRTALLTSMLVVFSLLLSACAGAVPAAAPGGATEAATAAADAAADASAATPAASGDAVELKYVLWDSLQLPPYQECANQFMAKNPNIKIKIEPLGWGDYWTSLQTSMVTGDAPDVYTNYIGQVPEYLSKGQIVDIQPLVERDAVPLDVYLPGLADLWVRDGKRFGLPKDWDTVAVIYNEEMLKQAGIDPASMETWTWNPQDGGTFEETIAKLTIDANGNNGLSPDFDKNNVVQYGFIPQGSGGSIGNTQWSHWAYSNGFRFQDAPWSSEYHYDSPKLAETLAWYRSLWLDKGYSPSIAEVTSLGPQALMQAGKGAMTTDGSWQVSTYANSDQKFGYGQMPIGPEGMRRTVTNSLADSIWTGTKHLEEAWQWVKYLASPECQLIVGKSGVVFPATPDGVQEVLKLRESQGLDVSAFFKMAETPGVTFNNPVADNFTDVTNIISSVMDQIMLGEASDVQATLKAANDEVNALNSQQ